LLGLIISIGSSPISIYAANNTIDIKNEIALLKNKIQELEIHIASADQANTEIITDKDINSSPSNPNKNISSIPAASNKDVSSAPTISSKDVSSAPAVPNKKKLSKKIKATKRNEKTVRPIFISNKSSQVLSPEIISPAVSTPLSWQGTDITALIVGGASAGYSKPSAHSGSFNILDFNPIFLFSYKDLLFLRSAVDFSLDDQGNTQTGLNYANLNLFLNDYATFSAGKFDSALGYFGQNLSPAWINKLPESPVGFNDGQAAPQAEVGIQLRGGLPLCNSAKANYVVYVSNGSQGFVDTTDITNIVINNISTGGFTNNYGNYVIGGRLGFLPIPKLEIGISAAEGKLVLFDMSDSTSVLQNGRHYNALGADISYKWDNLDLRAEIIQQQIRSQAGSIAPQSERWKAWYLQAAYRFPSTKWEPVVRYGKFTSSIANQQQGQLTAGVNYWFAPSISAQVGYEINHGQSGTGNNVNLFLMQLVFGF